VVLNLGVSSENCQLIEKLHEEYSNIITLRDKVADEIGSKPNPLAQYSIAELKEEIRKRESK